MHISRTFDGTNPLTWIFFTVGFTFLAALSSVAAVAVAAVWFVWQPVRLVRWFCGRS